MKIITSLAHKSNYGNSRKVSTIKFIVVHYTGNDGDSDTSNAKYFQTANRGSSAHYFVDDDSITQSVPNDHIAWHCGANKYYHASCRNANSIGVEICDTVKDGTYNISKKTRTNVIELIQSLMKKYDIPIGNVVRHYDVTHKVCPAYFAKDEKAWNEFKNGISKVATTSSTTVSTKAELKKLYKVQVGAYGSKFNADNMKARLKDAGYDAVIVEE